MITKAHHGQSLQCSAHNELTTSRENSQQDSTSLEVFCQSHLNFLSIIFSSYFHHTLTLKARFYQPQSFFRSLKVLIIIIIQYQFISKITILKISIIVIVIFSVAPTVSLHIGKALNLNDLEEGDDVYFECSKHVFMITW